MASSEYKYRSYKHPTLPGSVSAHEHVFICLLKEGLWQKGITSTPDGYDVHHVDFDKRNNDPSNLVLVTRSEHARIHAEHDRETGWSSGIKKQRKMKKYWDNQPEEERLNRMKAAKAKAVEKMLTEGPTEKQLSGLEKARAALKAKRDAARLERESK